MRFAAASGAGAALSAPLLLAVLLVMLLMLSQAALAQVCKYRVFDNVSRVGANLASATSASAELCAKKCCALSGCVAATFAGYTCYFKSASQVQQQNAVVESGTQMVEIVNATSVTGGEVGPCSKRGIAYGFSNPSDLDVFDGSVTWWYNWAASPAASMNTTLNSFTYTPMTWNTNFNATNLINTIPSTSTVLLGFNEPNFFTQSNISPAQAAAAWPAVESIAKARGLKLVSPAVNYCGPASECWTVSPFDYLDQFFGNCTSCTVDYIGLHWYACGSGALGNYINNARKYNRSIYLTEFACGDTPTNIPGQLAYMDDALTFLDNEPIIGGYAWFSGRTTAVTNASLLNADAGSLSDLGKLYSQPCVVQYPTVTSGDYLTSPPLNLSASADGIVLVGGAADITASPNPSASTNPSASRNPSPSINPAVSPNPSSSTNPSPSASPIGGDGHGSVTSTAAAAASGSPSPAAGSPAGSPVGDSKGSNAASSLAISSWSLPMALCAAAFVASVVV